MVALITGGTKGIGYEIALIYAKNGYDLVLNYLSDTENAIKVKEILEKYNVKVILKKGDISSEDFVLALLNDIKKEFGHIDVLINNAGISIDTPVSLKKVDDFKKILDVNLLGTFLTCKYIGGYMYENKNGVIVNISSNNSIDSYYPESMDYDASKAGVNVLTLDFAKLYAPFIRVNALALGWVETDMNKFMDPSFKSSEENKILLNRFAHPNEISKVVYFLTSDGASYINGSIIKVDGGIK